MASNDITPGIAPRLDENGFLFPGHDDTPDGEAARGSGAGVIGAGEPIATGPNEPQNPSRSDLQDDLGEDPTLIDEDSGD